MPIEVGIWRIGDSPEKIEFSESVVFLEFLELIVSSRLLNFLYS